MGRRTIYISEGDTVVDILECCPLAARVMENILAKIFSAGTTWTKSPWGLRQPSTVNKCILSWSS